MLNQLDDLAKTDQWLLTPEGHEEIKRVLNERPYLFQGKNPYQDALAFARKPIQEQPSGAQTPPAKKPLPILGGGSVVPPPSSETVSDDQELEQLAKAVIYHSRQGNKARAAELQIKMDEIAIKKMSSLSGNQAL